jgi:hypothetical protein
MISATVFRPVNGTISMGAFARYFRWQEGEPQSWLTYYPALSLDNRTGTSAVMRVGVQRETADSLLNTPPSGYTHLGSTNAWWAQPCFSTFIRTGVYDSPTKDAVVTTNSGGPGGSLTYTFEVKVTAAAGFFVESYAARLARFALESEQFISKEPFNRLLPENERNAIEMIDRLKPTSSVITFMPEEARYDTVTLSGPPSASSERINVTRFVTGRAAVPWPSVNPELNLFMVGGEETEPGHFYGMNRDLPVVFLDIESARAYKGEALFDDDYGSDDFFSSDTGFAPYELYRSEHQGPYFPILGALFPFVFNIPPAANFGAFQAIAGQNSLLIFEGRAVG